MLAAAKVVFQIELVLRRRSLVGDLVAFVAVVNEGEIELVLDLHTSDVDRTRQHMNVLSVEDFETVPVGILDIVAVGNARALGASVIQRIVATLLAAVFVGEVGLTAEGFDCLIQNRARLAGVVGVVEVDGRLSGRRRRRRSGLGMAQSTQQQNNEKTIHDSIGLEASGTILAVPRTT